MVTKARRGDSDLIILQGKRQEHGERVKLLKNLAHLVGCTIDISRYLPDRKQPDVMLINLKDHMLFIGDAKVTESPSNLTTQHRLKCYMRWAAVHESRAGSISLYAICFKKHRHIQGWVDTLYDLALEAGIHPINGGIAEITCDFNIVWFVF